MLCRRSISAASLGRLLTISLDDAFSYQRKAGMSTLEPIRMPHCDAPVWEDRSVCQGISRAAPSATHWAMVGASPLRIARRRTS